METCKARGEVWGLKLDEDPQTWEDIRLPHAVALGHHAWLWAEQMCPATVKIGAGNIHRVIISSSHLHGRPDFKVTEMLILSVPVPRAVFRSDLDGLPIHE
jgi:hypothetical protein